MQSKRRFSTLAVAGLLIYAVCLTTAVTLFILNQLSQAHIAQSRRMEEQATERYAGTVLIPDSASGRCRRLQFDNNTGALRETKQTPCRDETPAENSTQGRINAIRDAFAKH